ncbi:MAG: cyclic nucleotide-binding domain-containing protein [Acidobacteria bacterium]|nr:cyclic nucleotide-binding domain-containing protein [Acidobacteriota bacterium]
MIMIQETPQAERFKQQLRDSLLQETQSSSAIKIAKHDHVYTCGDRAEMVYFIESGQIKLLMLSPEGKECLLAIHTAGDIFGELCLSAARRFSWSFITSCKARPQDRFTDGGRRQVSSNRRTKKEISNEEDYRDRSRERLTQNPGHSG